MWIADDNAYTDSDCVVAVMRGMGESGSLHDISNHQLSRKRIHIECAFGMLENRWRILRKPLEMDLKHTTLHIFAMMVLHNRKSALPPLALPLPPACRACTVPAQVVSAGVCSGRSRVRILLCLCVPPCPLPSSP